MPGSTPIYGFPYPDPSDLVANYPALGQQLAEDIEDVLPTLGGMTFISTTDVTGTSGIFNNVFSATYNNYLIVLTGSVSVARSIKIRPRASGSNITTNLSRQRLYGESGTVGADYAASWDDAMFVGVNSSIIVMNWADPFATKKSSIGVHSATANAAIYLSSYAHEAATSYDGFEIFIDAGSAFTVTVKIYGYKNS
jgi:hypothetical protein